MSSQFHDSSDAFDANSLGEYVSDSLSPAESRAVEDAFADVLNESADDEDCAEPEAFAQDDETYYRDNVEPDPACIMQAGHVSDVHAEYGTTKGKGKAPCVGCGKHHDDPATDADIAAAFARLDGGGIPAFMLGGNTPLETQAKLLASVALNRGVGANYKSGQNLDSAFYLFGMLLAAATNPNPDDSEGRTKLEAWQQQFRLQIFALAIGRISELQLEAPVGLRMTWTPNPEQQAALKTAVMAVVDVTAGILDEAFLQRVMNVFVYDSTATEAGNAWFLGSSTVRFDIIPGSPLANKHPAPDRLVSIGSVPVHTGVFASIVRTLAKEAPADIDALGAMIAESFSSADSPLGVKYGLVYKPADGAWTEIPHASTATLGGLQSAVLENEPGYSAESDIDNLDSNEEAELLDELEEEIAEAINEEGMDGADSADSGSEFEGDDDLDDADGTVYTGAYGAKEADIDSI